MPRRRTRTVTACALLAAGLSLVACSSTTVGIGRAQPHTAPVAVTPVAPPSPTPTSSPSRHPLGARTLDRIITATGWEGLRGHRYEVVDSVSFENDRIVIVSVDGAALPGPVEQLVTELLTARRRATETPSFTAPVRLEPRRSRTIRFDVGRSDAGVEPASTHAYWRYFMFARTSQDIQLLSDPVPSFADSYTTWDPYDRINASMIRNEPDGDAWGVSTDLFYPAVEAYQTFTSIFTDPATVAALTRAHVGDGNLADLPGGAPQDLTFGLAAAGREVYCNSMGYALASAIAGVPYAVYARTAVTVPLYDYPSLDLHFFAITKAEYESLV